MCLLSTAKVRLGIASENIQTCLWLHVALPSDVPLRMFVLFLAENPQADIATALATLLNCSSTKPGTSWRVGVGRVTAEDKAKAQDAAAAAVVAAAAQKRIVLRQASHQQQAKPAVMTVRQQHFGGFGALRDRRCARVTIAQLVRVHFEPVVVPCLPCRLPCLVMTPCRSRHWQLVQMWPSSLSCGAQTC